MRRILVLVTLLAVLAGNNEIHAQAWLRQLGNTAKNAAKRSVEKAVEKAVDKSFDAAQQAAQPSSADYAARRAEAIRIFAERPSGGTPFYPVEKGLTMTYATGTGKGKPASYTRSTIVDIQWQDERNYSVVTSSEILDADKNPVTSEPMTAGATMQDGVVTYDQETMTGQLTAYNKNGKLMSVYELVELSGY